MGSGTVTIHDVAAAAGVSITTVSHVLSGKRPVAQATAARVLRTIEELGFRPNVAAQTLSTSRSRAVALLVPDITNPFYPVMARGLQDVVSPAGYTTLLCNTDADRASERFHVEDVLSRGVDGIVAAAYRLKPSDLRSWRSAPVPFVSVGNPLRVTGVDSVRGDDVEGGADAARLILEAGHRLVAVVTGPLGQPPADDRLAGFTAVLDESGSPVPPEFVVRSDFTTMGGTEAVRGLLKLDPRPTAIFCANDLMAIGALTAAQESGLRVPADVALVGYDDISAAALVSPPLTTIVNPAYEIGWQAGTVLLERMSGAHVTPRHIVVPHRIARRASV